MLKVGEVVTDSHFPEPVEIKKCQSYGHFYFLEAVGTDTKQVYDRKG